jgi:hypothetical protein
LVLAAQAHQPPVLAAQLREALEEHLHLAHFYLQQVEEGVVLQ